jgi:release factor glutamine methyltransferase
MFTLNCDRAYLYAHPERDLSAEERTRYDHALTERSAGIPAQYITGHQEFWGMDFIVSPAVLIPRPETEHVVETVLRLAASVIAGGEEDRDHRGHREAPGKSAQSLRIVDVGTGSGCITLALAKELPLAEIYATDTSAAALEVARANAARHQIPARIQFQQADLLQGLDSATFDFVVSNPPYVGESEEDQVQLEVRKFEPRKAVFAGPTGFEVIARLIPQAYAVLKPGGWLVMEISGAVAEKVRAALSGWAEVQLAPDLQGIPRVAAARKA